MGFLAMYVVIMMYVFELIAFIKLNYMKAEEDKLEEEMVEIWKGLAESEKLLSSNFSILKLTNKDHKWKKSKQNLKNIVHKDKKVGRIEVNKIAKDTNLKSD